MDDHEFEPISNMTPADGCFAVWDDEGTLVEQPLLGWVLMSVRKHTPDGPVKLPNQIHGMVCADRFGTRVVEFDENFAGYRCAGMTLASMQADYDGKPTQAASDERAEPSKEQRAVRYLLKALHLYPNYRLDNRAVSGCLLDAIRQLDPEAAKELADGVGAGVLLRERGYSHE